MKKIIGVLFVFLLLVSEGYCQDQPLQLTIKSDKHIYEVGEEIMLSGQIKNVSKDAIYFYPLEVSLTVTFEVKNYKGKKIDVPLPIIDLWAPKKNDFVLLVPDKTLEKSFKLHLEDVPDEYTIAVNYEVWQDGFYENGKHVDLNGWKGILTSNTITVNVVDKKKIDNLAFWVDKAPYPYENENSMLVKDSYKEKWIESSKEKYPEVIKKAKKVLKEWGQNQEKYEFKSKFYDYEILVFESENFISVTFHPIGVSRTSQEVEIRMTKESLEVLSILKGS